LSRPAASFDVVASSREATRNAHIVDCHRGGRQAQGVEAGAESGGRERQIQVAEAGVAWMQEAADPGLKRDRFLLLPTRASQNNKLGSHRVARPNVR
jgi:hypothetical protein